MAFDDVLRLLGEFGPYQMRLLLYITLPAMLSGPYKLIWIFQGIIPDHRCRLPGDGPGKTPFNFHVPFDTLNRSIPWEEDKNRWSRCTKYVPGTSDVVPCTEWVYDANTAIAQFDLVCDQEWLGPMAQSIVMTGEFLSAVTLMPSADRYGRRIILLLCLTALTAINVALAFAFSYPVFLVLRFILGIANPCIWIIAIPLLLEFVGPSKRSLCILVSCLSWVVSSLLLTGAAYLFPDWQHLQFVVAVPGLFLVLLWKLIPESPRWLVSIGKKDVAMKTVQTIAKVNKVPLPTNIEKILEEGSFEGTDYEHVSMLGVLRNKVIGLRILISSGIVFANAFVYYGLSMNTGNLVGNLYLNFALMFLSDLPTVMSALLVEKFGRKPLMISCFLVGGLGMLSTAFIPKDLHVIITVMSILGKMCIVMSGQASYLMLCEVFPTNIRTQALSLTTIGGRIGGIVAPYMVLLGAVWRPGPTIIFGISSLIGGFCTIFLPECKGLDLPETVEAGENIGRVKDKRISATEVVKSREEEIEALATRQA